MVFCYFSANHVGKALLLWW